MRTLGILEYFYTNPGRVCVCGSCTHFGSVEFRKTVNKQSVGQVRGDSSMDVMVLSCSFFVVSIKHD